MNIIETLAKEFNIKVEQVEKTVALIDEGNTIPFIARYRKEVTGSLDDTVLRTLEDRLTYLRNIEKRKAEVKELIAVAEETLSGIGRLVIRPSGTEPLVRIMAEGVISSVSWPPWLWIIRFSSAS